MKTIRESSMKHMKNVLTRTYRSEPLYPLTETTKVLEYYALEDLNKEYWMPSVFYNSAKRIYRHILFYQHCKKSKVDLIPKSELRQMKQNILVMIRDVFITLKTHTPIEVLHEEKSVALAFEDNVVVYLKFLIAFFIVVFVFLKDTKYALPIFNNMIETKVYKSILPKRVTINKKIKGWQSVLNKALLDDIKVRKKDVLNKLSKCDFKNKTAVFKDIFQFHSPLKLIAIESNINVNITLDKSVEFFSFLYLKTKNKKSCLYMYDAILGMGTFGITLLYTSEHLPSIAVKYTFDNKDDSDFKVATILNNKCDVIPLNAIGKNIFVMEVGTPLYSFVSQEIKKRNISDDVLDRMEKKGWNGKNDSDQIPMSFVNWVSKCCSIIMDIQAQMKCIEREGKNRLFYADLKPENIIIDSKGNPKLIDLGSAYPTREEDLKTGQIDEYYTSSYGVDDGPTYIQMDKLNDKYKNKIRTRLLAILFYCILLSTFYEPLFWDKWNDFKMWNSQNIQGRWWKNAIKLRKVLERSSLLLSKHKPSNYANNVALLSKLMDSIRP